MRSVIGYAVLQALHSRLIELEDVSHLGVSLPFAKSTSIELMLFDIEHPKPIHVAFQVSPLSSINESSIHQEFEMDSHGVHETYNSEDEGYQRVTLNTAEVGISGTIEISNPRGCLNGNEYAKKALLEGLTITTFVAAVVYGLYLRKQFRISPFTLF